MIGYCPQVNALNTFMTTFETVKFMALLNGVPFAGLNERVMQMLTQMDLESYADIIVEKFSGGVKRKLNITIAFVSFIVLVVINIEHIKIT